MFLLKPSRNLTKTVNCKPLVVYRFLKYMALYHSQPQRHMIIMHFPRRTMGWPSVIGDCGVYWPYLIAEDYRQRVPRMCDCSVLYLLFINIAGAFAIT